MCCWCCYIEAAPQGKALSLCPKQCISCSHQSKNAGGISNVTATLQQRTAHSAAAAPFKSPWSPTVRRPTASAGSQACRPAPPRWVSAILNCHSTRPESTHHVEHQRIPHHPLHDERHCDGSTCSVQTGESSGDFMETHTPPPPPPQTAQAPECAAVGAAARSLATSVILVTWPRAFSCTPPSMVARHMSAFAMLYNSVASRCTPSTALPGLATSLAAALTINCCRDPVRCESAVMRTIGQVLC